MNDQQLTRADKIAKLLAKAEGTDNEHEAEAFYSQAAALQAKWSIDDAMVAAAQGSRKATESPEQRWIRHTGTYALALRDLACRVGEAAGFRVLVAGKGSNRSTVWVGHPSDMEAAELLFTSLMIQQQRATKRFMKTWREERADWGFTPSERYNAQRSYMRGYAEGVYRALVDAKRSAEDEAKAEHGEPGVGLVRASKADAIDKVMKEFFPSTKVSRDRSRMDYGAAWEGKQDGRRADVGQRGRVAGGGRKELGVVTGRHGRHHALIAERVAAWRAIPVRGGGGLVQYRRREAAKKAAGTVAGHLRSEHRVRGNLATKTIEELLALHDSKHTTKETN